MDRRLPGQVQLVKVVAQDSPYLYGVLGRILCVTL